MTKINSLEEYGIFAKGWKPHKIKHLFEINPGKSQVSTLKGDTTVSFLPMENIGVDRSMNVSIKKEIQSVYGGYTYFGENDLLVAKITPCFENGKGGVARGLENQVGFGTTELHVLRARGNANVDFFNYVTCSHPFMIKGESQMTGSAGQKRVPDSFISNYEMLLPPLHTQRQIATYLDKKTEAIDTLIAKKQRMIELLEEKRSALINHVVTKGLNPDAPMKDSGVPWIGEVPAHWESVKLGHVSLINRGGSPRPAGDLRYFGGSYVPWITVGEITKDDFMYLTSTKTCLTQAGSKRSRTIAKDTLLLTNSGATLGVPKITKLSGCINDGVVAIEPYKRDFTLKKWLYFCLYSQTKELRTRLKQGSGQPNLNTDLVRGLSVAIPPSFEQESLLSRLTSRLDALHPLKEQTENSITKLHEYRQALITAAVTGKIDVTADPMIEDPEEAASGQGSLL